MHRTIINFLFFLIGFFLVAVPALVLAATYPATINGYRISPVTGATPDAVCKAYLDYAGIGSSQYSGLSGSGDCLYAGSYSIGHPLPNYSCPNGGTLNGNLCEKTCPAGETLNPDGTCGSACEKTSSQIWLSRPRTMTYVPENDPSGSYCVAGCSVDIAGDLSAPTYYESSTTIWQRYTRYQDGSKCSSATPSPTGSPSPPNEPVDDVPCDPGQGVVSNSSGKVQCVDKGKNPGADEPVVKKETTTKTHPDGSQTITTTIQTCTGAGACSTTTQITNTPATGGGTGIAGKPGTTNSITDSSANQVGEDSKGDFCAQNPEMQICKGGMATEETLKKLVEAPAIEDTSITNQSDFAAQASSSSSYQAMQERDRALVSGAENVGDQSNKSAWEAAMSSGWFEPIPAVSCSPYSFSFHGRSITIDWCEEIDKIQQVVAYCLWIGLCFGVFVMLTGGKSSS